MSILKELTTIYGNSVEEASREYELKEFLVTSLHGGAKAGCVNRILEADNMDAIQRLLEDGYADQLDFIYIDPPFNSGVNYKAYDDRWKEGLEGFLNMLTPRLILMRALLRDSGSIAVHLDWHAVHYVKVLMDEIFGETNFVNELVWSYKSGGAGKRSFAKKHDTILVYSVSPDYYFETQKEISYNRQGKPYRFKGVEEYQDANGSWYTLVNRKDVLSVDMVGRTSGERTGYPTQKPLALMQILLESLCPEGGIAADFFAGSGSLAVAAELSGRQFIICDQNAEAVKIAAERLDEKEASFLVLKPAE